MAERRKIFHRGDIWYHTLACQWYLHTVHRSGSQNLNDIGYQVSQSTNLPTLVGHRRAEFLFG